MSYDPSPSFSDAGNVPVDNLLASDNDIVTDSVTLITGQNLTRGALLGRITASGKYTLCNTGAADGSQTPVAILAQDTDATAADKVTEVYIGGTFNFNAMTLDASFGAALTAAQKDQLRGLNLYIKTNAVTA